MTVTYKRKSPEELTQTMPDTLAAHYEERDMFNQMVDDIAEGCISTIVEQNAIHEIEEQFAKFIKDNGIQSFDEIEVERRIEQSEGEDGSITYHMIQEYRKKQ